MRGRRGGGRGTDRGVLSISFAIVFPAILLFVLLVVQTAMLWYSESVALSAAREGANAGRAYTSTDRNADAHTAATAFLDHFDGMLGTPTVDPVRVDAETITVTVHIQPVFLPPGVHLTVTQQVRAPIERFVA
ncbi:TadE/TadG family type IV pilus assembly protein [Kitasatospora sp. NPDC058965]|uniref:TadE/TadG family type IV pilus assembly protein n=1 Tax=Kitasatospora sp. NPDC058965 TaxID=3346682 RepID=UPI0036A3CFD1